jgi:hypothetical protein
MTSSVPTGTSWKFVAVSLIVGILQSPLAPDPCRAALLVPDSTFALVSLSPGFGFTDRDSLPLVIRGEGLDRARRVVLVSGESVIEPRILSAEPGGGACSVLVTLRGARPGMYRLRVSTVDGLTLEGLVFEMVEAPAALPRLLSSKVLACVDSGRFRSVAWSPDGPRLAGFGSGVYVFDVAAGTCDHLSGFRAGYGFWSPDGEHLAYHQYHAIVRAFDLRTRTETEVFDGWGVRGSDLLGWSEDSLIVVALVPDSAPASVVAFRPDGARARTRDSRAAVIRSFEDGGQLRFWRSGLDGRGLRQLTYEENENLFVGAWFRDRSRFVGERFHPARGGSGMMVFNAGGEIEYKLPATSFTPTDVDPSGRWILGYREHGDVTGHSVLGAELVIMRSDGAAFDSLTATPDVIEDGDAKFSPRGAEIACVDHQGRVWVLKLSED